MFDERDHPLSDEVMTRAIERGDYLRGSPLRLGEPPGHKEWLHFCVYGEGIDVLVNFSIVDELHGPSGRTGERARLVCLLHTGDGWNGDVLGFSEDAVRLRRGYISFEMGENSVQFRNGVFAIRAALPARGIFMDLLLEPCSMPSPANNIDVEDGPPIHWIVLPRLLASGEVRVGARRYDLRSVPAYHDHNWGNFRWGRNFAWEWGYGLPESAANVWSLVFVRLSDRSHHQSLMQALFLWKGRRQHRIFRDQELTVTHHGLLRPERVFKLPRVMSLISPGLATDIPSSLVLEAAGRGDRVRVEFEFRDVAQVIIPNDDDLGVTIINEVNASYSIEGTVREERLALEGRAVVEFLGE